MTKEDYCTIIYSYLNTFEQKTIQAYKEVDENNYRNSVISNNSNLVPVWIFWWQGIDEIPEMVEICINSIKKNFPSQNVEIHFLDKNNYTEYISLPSIVEEKLNTGIIEKAHFSDVLRFALLYKYGGWWIDATIFLGKSLPQEFVYDKHFFTQKYGLLVDAPYPDPAKGRWSTFLLKSPKKLPFFKFLYDCWIFYLERHDTLLDYYLSDYFIAIAYDNYKWVKDMIDEVPPNNMHTGDLLSFYGNQEYDPEWIRTLTNDTQFFKMSYKVNLNKKTDANKLTTYGAMCEKFIGK